MENYVSSETSLNNENTHLRNQFFRDTPSYIEEFIKNVRSVDPEIPDMALVNRCFRIIHSIKTGSGFLEFRTLQNISHGIENILAAVREEIIPLDSARVEIIIEAADSLSTILDGIKEEGVEYTNVAAEILSVLNSYAPEEDKLKEIEESKAERIVGGINNTEKNKNGSAPKEHRKVSRQTEEKEPLKSPKDLFFDNFEEKLLMEARDRGETLYRIICTLSPETVMKYPRAYLIVNNLELEVNVISTDPPMEEGLEDDLYRVMRILCSAVKTKNEIASILNVDEIESVDIAEVGYEHYLNGNGISDVRAHLLTKQNRSTVNIELTSIERLEMYNQELRSYFGSAGDENTERNEEISKILSAIEKTIYELRNIEISDIFESVKDCIERQAKHDLIKMNIGIKSNNIRIPRVIGDQLFEPILHIAQNVLEHAVESKDERLRLGKKEKTNLTLNAEQRKECIKIKIQDDGKGINKEKINMRAQELGLKPENGKGLLAVLSQPGFTTRITPGRHSGRGVGLDAVVARIQENLRGRVNINSVLDEGTLIEFEIPTTEYGCPIMVIRTKDTLYALDARRMATVIPISEIEKITSGENIQVKYKNSQVNVLLPNGDFAESLPNGDAYVLIIDLYGKLYALYADELIIEKRIPEITDFYTHFDDIKKYLNISTIYPALKNLRSE